MNVSMFRMLCLGGAIFVAIAGVNAGRAPQPSPPSRNLTVVRADRTQSSAANFHGDVDCAFNTECTP